MFRIANRADILTSMHSGESFSKLKWLSKSDRFLPTTLNCKNSPMNALIESLGRNTLNRARRGLFGTTGKLFGNNVSHSERK